MLGHLGKMFNASLHADRGKNWHPSEVNIPTCSCLDVPPAHTWCTDNRLWCMLSICMAPIPSFVNVGSLMTPSAVAFNTDPNAGVIGMQHDIVSRKLLVLLACLHLSQPSN